MGKRWFLLYLLVVTYSLFGIPKTTLASSSIDNFWARHPIHLKSSASSPIGLIPDQIKQIYHLPLSGGQGTIAIVGAYAAPEVEKDLAIFSQQFNLPTCNHQNGCLEIHPMSQHLKTDSGWEMEIALDTEWSHAIAPNAKILFIESKTASGRDLLAGVDFARSRPDVVAISMSWGGPEFAGEASLDSHFSSHYGASFFASSGDNGAGVSWPASSSKVIGVGGTSLHFGSSGQVSSESAWNGSGGGVSQYQTEPSWQNQFGIVDTAHKRATPDVAYAADPNSGFSIYHQGWKVVGGTSAGAPQWAAIRALGKTITNSQLYQDALKKYPSHFKDIRSGQNGSCGASCRANKGYDLVTGLGSPLTVEF